MTEAEFKSALTAIKKNNFALGADKCLTYSDYAPYMLKYIGDIDPAFRDGVNYEVFIAWLNEERFTQTMLRDYLDVCLDDEHLFYRLGEDGTDSVFTRSFSALFISAILQVNSDARFLDAPTLRRTLTRLMQWYECEKDMRGFTAQKGWAHTAAHGADAFAQLALCEELGSEELMQILYALGNKFEQGRYVYIDREPQRVCVAVCRITARGLLSDAQIVEWLASIDEEYVFSDDIEAFHRWVNKQNFFTALYFAAKRQDAGYKWLERAEKAIRS
jgi:hypothetical protein